MTVAIPRREDIGLTYERVCHDLFGPDIDSRLPLLNMLSGGLKLYRKMDTEVYVSLSGFVLFQTRFRSRQDGGGRRSAPEYPAPELLLGGEESETSEGAADRWMLGVLLFEMLSGLPPLYAADAASIRYQIIDNAPRSGRRTLQDAPRESGIVYTGPEALPDLPVTSSSDEGFVCGAGSGDDRHHGHKYVARPA